ncbi:V-type ATP synthase subunit E [Spirochaetia bacterium 38H-sp]|uniref:V-type ATP synthase subunit E n=1 Tax=Rarispira pelagica TaxID=3141764 RepID=A0ABU9UAL6_9SPIR
METAIKELIESLKRDGVEAGQKQADEIVRDAKIRADEIIEKARQQAKVIREEAEREASQFRMSAEEAVRQAGRDLVLSVKKELEEIASFVLLEMIKESYSDKAVEDAVVSVVSSWSVDEVGDVELRLPENVSEALMASLKKRLADKIAAGLELRPVKGLDKGFKIALKDGSAYYDFSEKGIVEVLSAFLNPRVAALLSESIK